MKRVLAVAGISALLTLVGCATTGALSDNDRLGLYRAHAGPPISSFNLFGGISGWTELGDKALAVWTRPREAYLLDLSGPCFGLDSALAIGLTSSVGSVSRGFDKVLVRDPSGMPQAPCMISQIRKLDVSALKASEQALRQAQLQEREEAGQAPPAR